VVVPTGRYVVPTGRVVVPTGRYVVPTGRVVVPTGRYVVPTGRVVVPTGRYVVPTGRVGVSTGRLLALILWNDRYFTYILQSPPKGGRSRIAEVLIVGYEHVVMNCGLAGNRVSSMSKALLIPKYQDYQTQHVLIIGTSQSRQHDKSEPVSYYLTD
nr:hypothetical protein [Tanacetum cinerariifolium]